MYYANHYSKLCRWHDRAKLMKTIIYTYSVDINGSSARAEWCLRKYINSLGALVFNVDNTMLVVDYWIKILLIDLMKQMWHNSANGSGFRYTKCIFWLRSLRIWDIMEQASQIDFWVTVITSSYTFCGRETTFNL